MLASLMGPLPALSYGPLTRMCFSALPLQVFVAWLDAVTYLHHHGPSDEKEEIPWYRGEVG